jgi:hypothetical protein
MSRDVPSTEMLDFLCPVFSGLATVAARSFPNPRKFALQPSEITQCPAMSRDVPSDVPCWRQTRRGHVPRILDDVPQPLKMSRE